jgi:hypothetical protein
VLQETGEQRVNPIPRMLVKPAQDPHDLGERNRVEVEQKLALLRALKKMRARRAFGRTVLAQKPQDDVGVEEQDALHAFLGRYRPNRAARAPSRSAFFPA